jgi:membrane-associated phospholipid phosphatase
VIRVPGWVSHAVRRRKADAVILICALAVVVVTLLMLGRIDLVPEAERSVFHAVNDLPGTIEVVVTPLMFLGTLAAVPIFMIVCGLFRRFRMGFVVGIVGLAAYLLARAGKHAVGRGRPGEIFDQLHLRDVNASGLGFPSGHAAVAAAVVVAALPYLPRRWRWSVLLFPVFMAFARVYVGAHLPLDVVSGAAIGAAAAALLHLALGVPLTPSADPPVVAPAAPEPAHADGAQTVTS